MDVLTLICTVCSGSFTVATSLDEAAGATCDCPACNALLMIEVDGSTIDFGKKLQGIYTNAMAQEKCNI